jgi:hypothetical protein
MSLMIYYSPHTGTNFFIMTVALRKLALAGVPSLVLSKALAGAPGPAGIGPQTGSDIDWP